MSKAYEIVKIQKDAIQSKMSNLQAAGKKNRSKMDNIMINAMIENKDKVTIIPYFLLMQKNALTNYG